MKSRFTTIDVSAAVNDLKNLEGARILNVYDINHKTYIMKLSSAKEKFLLLFESGIRIHRAYHDYQKSSFPSNFSVKLRKHLNNRRIFKVSQLGMDRIVDMQVDEGERCFHVIVELYDRGNIVLTDSSYTILNILRPRSEKDTDVRLVVKERYPLPTPRMLPPTPSVEEMTLILTECNQNLPLKRAIISPGTYSGPLIEHVLILEQLDPDLEVNVVENKDSIASRVVDALRNAAAITESIRSSRSHGFITYKLEKRSDGSDVETFLEYHPYLFHQHERGPYKKFESFSEAVDAFCAAQDAQKQQQTALRVEKEAMKKLENVKKDQFRRIMELEDSRDMNMKMADLIIFNQDLVDSAVAIISRAIAQKASWGQIKEMHRKAVENGDQVARSIVSLDLGSNKILMRLSDEESNSWDVPIDVGMTAFSNSRELYQCMKAATEKIVRTKAAANKAIKNSEAKTHNAIKEVHSRVDTARVRKKMWFEEFIWFISSENYMVIVGRDADQNELLVKRYLRPGDIYVHADAHGAASVVIRNKKGGGPIPPKTMTEAAQMAVCSSSSWSSHIVSNAWWVYDYQVSKVAPSGEYLVHGSFMIRGKKNFMPRSPLQLGFGILFRVDENMYDCNFLFWDVYPTPSGAERESVEEEKVNVEEELENKYIYKHLVADNGDDGEDYPDIQLDVPIIRGHVDTSKDYSVISFGTNAHFKKNAPTKDKETKQYLEKKIEEERKANASKKAKNIRKHKMDKIRRKYRDQDDEEREMRLAAIGARGKNKEEPLNNTKKPKMSDRSMTHGPVNVSVAEETSFNKNIVVNNNELFRGTAIHKTDKQLDIEHDKNINEDSSGKILGPDLSAEMANLHLEDEHTEEDQAVDDDEESKEIAVAEDSEGLISQLVSNPLPDDVLLYALTMVGPYQAFSKFKYKVKITPGTSKKNKAGKAALDLFLRVEQGDPREKALIRTLVGNENACRNIPKGCRILAPQLYAK